MLARFRGVALLTATLLLTPAALAQQVAPVLSLPQPPTYAGTYDLATGVLTPPGPGDVGTSSTLYDNSTANGSFFNPGTGIYNLDWGTVNFGGTGATLDSIQIAYATSKTTAISLRVRLHQGATGNGVPGTTIFNQLLTGLPASTGGTQGFIVDVTLASPLAVTDGAFGWSYQATETLTGPLLMGPPNAAGVVNFIDQYQGSTNAYLGTGNFGGTPFASFHIKLNGRPNTPPALPWTNYGVKNGMNLTATGSATPGSVDNVINITGTPGKKAVLVVGLSQVDVVGGQFGYSFYTLPWLLVIPNLTVPLLGGGVDVSAPLPIELLPGNEIFFQSFGQAAGAGNTPYTKWSAGLKLVVQ
ncbi:MAG: hypothetical protein ACT4PU_10680 [Planctomycetota bacterium]